MSQKDIMHILERVSSGELSPSEAALELKMEPFQDLGFAKIDHHRELRQGIAEVIYGEGKTPEQILKIVEAMLERGQKTVLITRMSAKAAELVSSKHDLDYRADARLGIVGVIPDANGKGKPDIIMAKSLLQENADCRNRTAEILGNKVTRLYDVGVSGVHRLLSHMPEIMTARVIVAVAGMEGALPSVIGGLADCPVIAVPASVGYGASFGGVAALLSMLNSCASGMSVVNIDNGFGAGYLASMINHLD